MALTKIRGNAQIQALSVTNSEIAFPDAANPDGILLAKIEDGDLLVKSDGSVSFTAPISGVAPVGPNDLVTKSYADAVATGLDVKNSVRAIALSPVTLSGPQTVDGVALIAGDRVLVAGQAAGETNGIYVVQAGAWVRSEDADNSPNGEVTTGMFTFVEEGGTNAGSGFVLTTVMPITLGTTPLEFVQFSQAGVIVAGAGLTKSGSVINVNSANAGIVVNADDIELQVSADGTLAIGVDGVKLAALAPGQILVGNNSSVASPVTASGDVTISSTGDFTVVSIDTDTVIADGSIALDKLASGTAGQIIVAGAGGVPAYVTASGDVTVSAAGAIELVANSVGATELADDAVDTAAIVDAAVTLDKIETLDPAKIIIGTATGNQQVSLSGDVTITEAGVVSINPATVVRVADIIKRETPTGLVDGTNVTYVLANVPKAGLEDVYVNGVLQEGGAGNDYTISGDTITMLFTLQPGDKIRVSYYK